MATSWPKETVTVIERLEGIQADLCNRFVERDWAIKLLTLAAVCREHVLLIGPPGTAKTELVTRFAECMQARQFSYLLTRFTEPSELFGPLDLERFHAGVYEIRTDGMLPMADMAFLDEVFEGSSAILNTLLTLVNERVFYNGANPQTVNLVSLVGASNTLPDDPALAAFGDRFMLRTKVDPVADSHLGELVDVGIAHEMMRISQLLGQPRSRPLAGVLSLDDLKLLSMRVAEVDTAAVRPVYETVIREARAQGVQLSDRRIVKGLKLVAGAAVLDKETVARARHLWPLNFFWTELADADLVGRVVQPHVEADGGDALEQCRKADEILADAAFEAEDWRSRDGRPTSDSALVSSLNALNRLRTELLRCHPHNPDALAKLDATVGEVMEKFGEGERGEAA